MLSAVTSADVASPVDALDLCCLRRRKASSLFNLIRIDLRVGSASSDELEMFALERNCRESAMLGRLL